jgi:hypothetical protein
MCKYHIRELRGGAACERIVTKLAAIATQEATSARKSRAELQTYSVPRCHCGAIIAGICEPMH